MFLIFYFILAKKPRSNSAIIACHICLNMVTSGKCMCKYIELDQIIKMRWIMTSHFPSDGIFFSGLGKEPNFIKRPL